jgi:hypothetical protein
LLNWLSAEALTVMTSKSSVPVGSWNSPNTGVFPAAVMTAAFMMFSPDARVGPPPYFEHRSSY